MRLAIYVERLEETKLALAAQIGEQDIVTSVPADHGGTFADYRTLIEKKQRIEDSGLQLRTVESVPISDRAKLGLPGRERDTDVVCRLIENLGRAGIGVACYNWMAGFGWLRTSLSTRTRGGALSSSYDHWLMADAPQTPFGIVENAQLWDALAWFLERVVPVAASVGVRLALHPDDPPLSPIAGMARIIRSVGALDRVVSLADNPVNGITYCQGNFGAMGADIPATIHHFGATGRLHFAHFRHGAGTVPTFSETFHDTAGSELKDSMQAFLKSGLDGDIRPDHTPTLAGESNDNPGYQMLGRLHAVGFMQGLLSALDTGTLPQVEE